MPTFLGVPPRFWGSAFAFIVISVSEQSRPALATQLWTSAPDPAVRAANNWPANDYMDLFGSDNSWKSAAHIETFGITARFALFSADDELSHVISGLKDRHIALLVQGEVLTYSETCGKRIEGYGGPNEIIRIAQRLQRLGADLKYIDMDEPLYFGHQYRGEPGRPACRSSIKDVASQAAEKLRPLFSVYPNAVITESEPYGGGAIGGAWIADIIQWHKMFESQLGRPVSIFEVDMVWSDPSAPRSFATFASMLKETGIQIAIIYHGPRNADSDEQWSDDVFRQATLFERDLGLRPDITILESWMDRPRRLLPETQQGSLTNALAKYIDFRRHFGLELTSHPCPVCR